MSGFPTLSKGQDSQYYSEEKADPARRNETDGGYTLTRPRYTRPPATTYTTGFTDITNTDKQTLEAFYDSVYGGSKAFDWTNPVTGLSVQVRFKDKLTFDYAGIGPRVAWDVTKITLEEV